MAGVFFPGPDNFNRPPDAIGHGRRFLYVVLGQPTAKAAAEKGGIDGDIVGPEIGYPGRRDPSKVRRLGGRPHVHPVFAIPGRGVHGL